MQAAAVIVRKPIRPPTRSLTLLFSKAIIRDTSEDLSLGWVGQVGPVGHTLSERRGEYRSLCAPVS